MDKAQAVREFRDAQDLSLRLYARQGRAETLTDKARAYVAALDKRVATVMVAGTIALGVHLDYRDKAQAPPPEATSVLTTEQVVGADVDDGILNQEAEPASSLSSADGFVQVKPSSKLVHELGHREKRHHSMEKKAPRCSGPSPK